jgi:hypothetical protein
MDEKTLALLIPILVPAAIAALKAAIPALPKWALPILAPLLGAVAEIAASYSGVGFGGAPGLTGALLGAAGTGVREIADQTRKRLAESQAPPPPAPTV